MNNRTKPVPWVWLVATLAFAFVGLVQAPETLTGEFIWNEAFSEYIPWRIEAARALRSGEFPFFTERVFGGMPLFTAAYNGVLYPPNWLYLLFDERIANVLSVFHVVVGGLGMMAYLREHRIGMFASFTGALFFTCSTFFFIHEPHIAMREAALFAPWLAWGALHLLNRPTRRRCGLLALVMALQLAIGYWQVTLFTLCWIAADWVLMFSRSRAFARTTALLATAMALGIGLMAVQLLPTLPHVAQTPRDSMTLESWQAMSFPPSHSIMFWMPRALGTVHRGWIGAPSPGELLVTLSPVANALALLSLFFLARKWHGPRRRFVIVYVVGVIISLILAIGHFFPPNALLFHVPPFSFFRIPARWLFLTTTFASILAAYSLDELLALRAWKRPLLLIAAWTVLGGVLLLAFTIAWEHPQQSTGELLRATLFERTWAVWTYAIILGYTIALALPKRFGWLAAAVVTLLAATEYRLIEDGNYFPPAEHRVARNHKANPLLAKLPPQEIGRLYSLYLRGGETNGALLPHNTHLYEGYRSLGGYTPLHSALIPAYLSIGQDGRTWQNNALFENPAPLEALGVTHLLIDATNATPEQQTAFEQLSGTAYEPIVVHEDRLAVFQLLRTPPAVDLASAWQSAESESDAWNALWHRDNHNIAFVHGEPPTGFPHEVEPLGSGPIEVVERSGNRLLLRSNLDAPGIAIIRGVYWKGWKQRVLGEKAPGDWQPLVRANGLLRCAAIPAGDTLVEIRFEPPLWRVGLVVSAVSLILLLLILIKWKPMRSPTTPKILAA